MLQAPATRRRGSSDLSRNHKILYGLIRHQPSLSRAELVRACGLTFPSVSRLVDDLIHHGLVEEGTTRRGAMGKPPIELSINPDSAYSLGVHLEGSRAKAALINASGEVMKEVSFSQAPLAELLGRLLEQVDVPSERLLGVGVTTAESKPDTSELDASLQTLGVRVIFDTDIAASVRAERYFGSGREATTFLYFDALHLQVGAMVGPKVLARRGTLNVLLGLADEAALQKEDRLPRALDAAVALLQAEMLVVGGLGPEDFERFRSSFTVVPVLPACKAATNPVQAAATFPLFTALVP